MGSSSVFVRRMFIVVCPVFVATDVSVSKYLMFDSDLSSPCFLWYVSSCFTLMKAFLISEKTLFCSLDMN